jgi:hypothetical protein
MKRNKYFVIVLLTSVLFIGWGSIGHKIINKNFVLSLHSQMSFLSFWTDSLAAHGSDADYRKNWDPTEGPKHYIDIDEYPEFISTRRIIQNYDSIVAKYGSTYVIDIGILPWTIIAYVDSLKKNFQLRNWNRAMLIAADLGHYVADAHMPLHITKNYDGQFTQQNGIHSRYESNMISRYSTYIIYTGDSSIYIHDVNNFVFNFIYTNYNYVDSLLAADIYAKNIAGGYNDTYYLKLWERTKDFTIKLFKNSSYVLASLIYTAWVNAGKPTLTDVKVESVTAEDFKLFQNYPNPFNPSTKILYTVGLKQLVSIKIFDILGNELGTLVNEEKQPGNYEIVFSASDLNLSFQSSPLKKLTSGILFYQMKSGDFVQSCKMICLK